MSKTAMNTNFFLKGQEASQIISDYLEMCKPRVVLLMLVTAWIGMLLASPGWLPRGLMISALTGIGFVAGAAAVVNHLVDRGIDARMARTHHRPLPKGRVQPLQAAIFALLLTGLGMWLLISEVNELTAALTFVSLLGYAGVYTLYLKRATPQNIVIGGLAGAAPPLLGWTAVTNHIDAGGLLLALIIFVWTPPHFWALAIHRHDDYRKAEIPMFPVIYGIELTQLHILLYTILLLLVSLLPCVIGMCGIIYLVFAVILGAVYLYYAIILYRNRGSQIAIQAFRYSIYYLFLLFIGMLLDHYWPMSGGM